MAAILTALLVSMSIAGAILMAGANLPRGYASISMLSALGIVALAAWNQLKLERAGVPRAELAASTARYVSFVWISGALTLLLVYGNILIWREWLTFGLAMLAVGALTYGFSVMFRNDAARGRSDDAMLGFARTLGIVQLVGMVIAMVGLFADGKVAVAIQGNRSDWAANSTFFAGAMGIALITGLGLLADGRAAARKNSSTPDRA